MKHDTQAERLKFAQERSGRSVAQLSESIGITPKALYKWLSGDTQAIEADHLCRFCVETGFSPRWLLYKQGPQRMRRLDDLSDQIGEEASALSEAARREVLEFIRFKRAG